jgi:hypothetical protein
MNRVLGFALAVGLLASWSPAQAAASATCAERFQAAGIDPGKLHPGGRGRLEGYDFIVAADDTDAAKICARVDADRARAETLRVQLSKTNIQLSRAQEQVDALKGGGPIKDNYLFIEGALLAWAVIASIWAGYFAGRLNPRHRHSF